ncbi:MAG: nucleotide pyrophosphatase/phosphodiesterase family protein [Verrucomicrobiota bacterium]
MNRTAVLNVVGLTQGLLGHLPRIQAFAKGHGGARSFRPVFPAVTCSAQATYVTGQGVGEHGIVGNGWYDRDLCEVHFWKQPDGLVRGEKLWERLRAAQPGFTCAKLFWWFNMYSRVDYAITPRPLYPADGRKVFDVYTTPLALRHQIQSAEHLGAFPFQKFWGPAADIESSRWIAASARWLEASRQPSLSLVYLPHLDYGLQRWGPGSPEMAGEFAALDELVGELLEFYQGRGVRCFLLSEYGISPVSQSLSLNRFFRQAGWLQVKRELGRELLDPGASQVFAVADHQVAQVVVNDPALVAEVRVALESLEGVESVRLPSELGWEGRAAVARAGDLVVTAAEGFWFDYYYWEEDGLAPDFARTIDIHRKPGYDPCELFLDPQIRFPKLRLAHFLARKRLGFRALLEVIPIAPQLVKGSHGRAEVPVEEQPVIIGPEADSVQQATDVFTALLANF